MCNVCAQTHLSVWKAFISSVQLHEVMLCSNTIHFAPGNQAAADALPKSPVLIGQIFGQMRAATPRTPSKASESAHWALISTTYSIPSPSAVLSMNSFKAKAKAQHNIDTHDPITVTYRHILTTNITNKHPLRVVALVDSDAFYAACEMESSISRLVLSSILDQLLAQVRLGVDRYT